MDSKMAAMRATIESEAGTEEWTDRNPALRRAILRSDKYLGKSPKGSAPGTKVAEAPPRGTAQLDFGARKV